MAEETLWNGVVLSQPASIFPLGTDAVACAGFARPPRGARVADLGCGGGAIALMLLASDPSLEVTGVELDQLAAEAARENARRNGLAFRVVEGDLRQVSSLLPAGGMDWAVANPPYFPAGSGPAGRRAQARREDTLSLEELCRAAAWLLKWGGGFTLVHRPERLAEVMWHLKTCGLEPKRLQLLRHQPQKPVSLLLVEAKKGAAPGLLLEPDLILRDEAGRETAQCRALYHRDGKECD
ncbi:MAG TPA: methyltransferase [Candidatus Avoscillospira avicola]|uniref:Methyltransferase n=1 Tax=Candidatus Avoscillospira avicola TaxID=2840706 RepID=A0A9D1DHR2_9FIRM|nr:methyltransferase [Candidatus Avoscillospira avicola]